MAIKGKEGKQEGKYIPEKRSTKKDQSEK